MTGDDSNAADGWMRRAVVGVFIVVPFVVIQEEPERADHAVAERDDLPRVALLSYAGDAYG